MASGIPVPRDLQFFVSPPTPPGGLIRRQNYRQQKPIRNRILVRTNTVAGDITSRDHEDEAQMGTPGFQEQDDGRRLSDSNVRDYRDKKYISWRQAEGYREGNRQDGSPRRRTGFGVSATNHGYMKSHDDPRVGHNESTDSRPLVEQGYHRHHYDTGWAEREKKEMEVVRRRRNEAPSVGRLGQQTEKNRQRPSASSALAASFSGSSSSTDPLISAGPVSSGGYNDRGDEAVALKARRTDGVGGKVNIPAFGPASAAVERNTGSLRKVHRSNKPKHATLVTTITTTADLKEGRDDVATPAAGEFVDVRMNPLTESYERGRWLLGLLVLQSTSSFVLDKYQVLPSSTVIIHDLTAADTSQSVHRLKYFFHVYNRQSNQY